MANVEFHLRKGELNTRTLVVRDASRRPADLAGVVLTFTVRAVGSTTDLLTLTLANQSPTTAGLATLTVPEEALEDFTSYGYYRYLVQTQAPSTIISGPLIIDEEWG